MERIGDAEVVYTNKTPITKETMDACPGMKFIGVLATGYNIVDVAAAKEKGIRYPTFLHTEQPLFLSSPSLFCWSCATISASTLTL
mgnify:FL=1